MARTKKYEPKAVTEMRKIISRIRPGIITDPDVIDLLKNDPGFEAARDGAGPGTRLILYHDRLDRSNIRFTCGPPGSASDRHAIENHLYRVSWVKAARSKAGLSLKLPKYTCNGLHRRLVEDQIKEVKKNCPYWDGSIYNVDHSNPTFSEILYEWLDLNGRTVDDPPLEGFKEYHRKRAKYQIITIDQHYKKTHNNS